MMKPVIKRTLIILAIIVTLVALISYWQRPGPVRILVSDVDIGTVEKTVANTRAGTIKSCKRAGLAPATGGQIAYLPIHKGDQVRTGQLLVEIWNQDLAAQLLLAKEEMAAARARAEEACVTASVAQKEAKRTTELLRKKLASEEAADKAVGNALATQASCEAARSSIEVSKARIRLAEAAVERTRLRAPFDGIVAEINGEVGEFATPSPIGIPTPPTVDLVDTTCMYITAPIDEVDAPEIRVGMDARISLDAFRGNIFEGLVKRIAPYVQEREKQARTVEIEADFVHPRDLNNLLPGYSADLEIVLTVKKNTLRIPTESLQTGSRVMVFNPKSGKIEERTIRTGISNWKFTEVISGLKKGEKVITTLDRKGVKAGASAKLDTQP